MCKALGFKQQCFILHKHSFSGLWTSCSWCLCSGWINVLDPLDCTESPVEAKDITVSNHDIVSYTCVGIASSVIIVASTYLSILCSERILHTVCPFLHTCLQPLPSEACTLVLPAAFRRSWSFILWVVSSSAGGHLVGAVSSCIRSVWAEVVQAEFMYVACSWMYYTHACACGIL